MLLELESVFNTPGLSVPFSFRLPEQPAEAEARENGGAQGIPFAERPLVEGRASNRSGIVTLEAAVTVRLHTLCDRCASPFETTLAIPVEHTLVRSLNDDANDELILVEDTRFSPDALVWEDIVFALPAKLLCREGCAGICAACGKNLNDGPCGCRPIGDPRLAALRNLLDEKI
ncbi:MAG: DUF177 domain-containing protein [Oscillospiraceae bacterium]|nr:DUF177 domain-containing protein [Oscillospiraceae bacterium]